ncbi:MAG TPA: hypothetical protein VLS89_06690 [Candidatus Nanopelagicales bacterium]|nr:hypothetical protein [Candidatus Nanopelagicales bacterium]
MPLPRLVSLPVRLLALALVLALVLGPAPVFAQPAPSASPAAPPAPAPPSAESWAGELDALSRWIEQRRERPRCTERCYTLDRLTLRGAVGEGPLEFELTGGVLAEGPMAVPLFGPPSQVRIEQATIDGKEAAIGFDGDRYFLWTGARRFTLKGALALEGDLALSIPGPLNRLDADLAAGAVVEGARLSGLVNATLHFSRGGAAAPVAGPTVFQLSRAVRVGREIGFEYRLVMRSGTDLGVVRLPLSFEEKVLDVSGAVGWRVEDKELVLPTSGRSAEMTITGTLPKVGAFRPDARSPYEWWLIESDAEHRVTVQGEARQVDSAESPIARTQATSRLLLVQRGQQIEVGVQALASVEVLAAVVRGHERTMVLTERGDVVADDDLSYENNGIDYLLYAPGGRPIYLASDGKAERIMHQGKAAEEILVPLRTGSHGVRVQSLGQAALGRLGGRVTLAMPSYPLTASRVGLSVGLPERVIPVALLGGDRPALTLGWGDLVAAVIGFGAGFAAVRAGAEGAEAREGARARARARRLRVLGGLVVGGLWFLSPGAYGAALAALAIGGAIWVITRLLGGARRMVALVVVVGGLGLVGLVMVAALATMGREASAPSYSMARPASDTSREPSAPARKLEVDDRTGNFMAQGAKSGVLEGVTPVALTMPSYARRVYASRELVTKDRPFRPVLVYVTWWALLPLVVAWLGGAGALVVAHWGAIRGALRRAGERLGAKEERGAGEREEEEAGEG